MTGPSSVFVIDDDASVRKALARLIRSSGLRVETFDSAEAFLAFLVPDAPMCLVLDLRLKGPSGLEVQDLLRQSHREMPIIFLTGYGNVPASVRAMKAGAVDFLQKPFQDEQLLDAIRRALVQSGEARARQAHRTDIERRLRTLTPRQREVLDLVVTGLLNKQIAARLGAAERTIKIHRGRVMRKMEADSVADLVRMMHGAGTDMPAARPAPAPRTTTS